MILAILHFEQSYHVQEVLDRVVYVLWCFDERMGWRSCDDDCQRMNCDDCHFCFCEKRMNCWNGGDYFHGDCHDCDDLTYDHCYHHYCYHYHHHLHYCYENWNYDLKIGYSDFWKNRWNYVDSCCCCHCHLHCRFHCCEWNYCYYVMIVCCCADWMLVRLIFYVVQSLCFYVTNLRFCQSYVVWMMRQPWLILIFVTDTCYCYCYLIMILDNDADVNVNKLYECGIYLCL